MYTYRCTTIIVIIIIIIWLWTKNNFVNPPNGVHKKIKMHRYAVPSSPVVGRSLNDRCQEKPSGKTYLRSGHRIAKNFGPRDCARLHYQAVKLQHAGYYLVCFNPQTSRKGSAAEWASKLINRVGKLNANTIMFIFTATLNYSI